MQALQWKNEDRKTAQEMLRHPWLAMDANYSYRVEKSEESDKDDKDDEDDEESEADTWNTFSSDDESEGEGSDSSEFELI
mmetsp:Transcript_17128/g.15101  ORF Transcript_17128/g.15101 Transcript_17128/m.15101 type:complete len:80 (+) Transcript_17128:312-551(+)